MKELINYTDEELKNELKRRITEKRLNTPREIIHKEFEAIIVEVDNIHGKKRNGQIQYRPFCFWRYRVTAWTTPIDLRGNNVFYTKQNLFNKSNAPKVGDKVKLRYRVTKKESELSCISKAKIIEIINNE